MASTPDKGDPGLANALLRPRKSTDRCKDPEEFCHVRRDPREAHREHQWQITPRDFDTPKPRNRETGPGVLQIATKRPLYPCISTAYSSPNRNKTNIEAYCLNLVCHPIKDLSGYDADSCRSQSKTDYVMISSTVPHPRRPPGYPEGNATTQSPPRESSLPRRPHP